MEILLGIANKMNDLIFVESGCILIRFASFSSVPKKYVANRGIAVEYNYCPLSGVPQTKVKEAYQFTLATPIHKQHLENNLTEELFLC